MYFFGSTLSGDHGNQLLTVRAFKTFAAEHIRYVRRLRLDRRLRIAFIPILTLKNYFPHLWGILSTGQRSRTYCRDGRSRSIFGNLGVGSNMAGNGGCLLDLEF
jgi:hypothetical protein